MKYRKQLKATAAIDPATPRHTPLLPGDPDTPRRGGYSPAARTPNPAH